jgi:hypothetical protein
MTGKTTAVGTALAILVAATAIGISPTNAQPYGGWGMMGGGYGPGMMQGYGDGPGMMGGYGPGYGWGMMGGPGYGTGGYGPGWMHGGGWRYGPGYGQAYGPQGDLKLSAEDVKNRLEGWIAWQGNPRLKVGDVKEKDADTIEADIVTKDNSLVQRFIVNRHTGFYRPSTS